jgi:hypothetical protein
MVMTQIELQNTIGRIDPTSGLPNEHQLFEDLEDLAKRSPGERKVGLLVELVSTDQSRDARSGRHLRGRTDPQLD